MTDTETPSTLIAALLSMISYLIAYYLLRRLQHAEQYFSTDPGQLHLARTVSRSEPFMRVIIERMLELTKSSSTDDLEIIP